MSVQWDLSNIENAKELCWFENTDPNRTENEKFVLNPVTSGLIHISQFTGVSKITKKPCNCGKRKDTLNRLFPYNN